MLHIIGKVPNPKKAIKIILFTTSPVDTATAAAIYTRPHGSSPFNKPIENNEEKFFFEKKLPNTERNFWRNVRIKFWFWKDENRLGRIIKKIINTPKIIDSHC